jgi:FlaA1/EpsC-like NDP-sugar epimerase
VRPWTGPPRWRLVRLITLLADLGCLVAGMALAVAARTDLHLSTIDWSLWLTVTSVGASSFMLMSLVLRLHQGRYAVGTADESKALALAVLPMALVGCATVAVVGRSPSFPLSVPIVGAALAFLLILAFRIAIRSQREGALRPRSGEPTLVFGAGSAGDDLIRSMLNHPDSPYVPVGLLDDDPAKRHLRIRGVRMLGGRDGVATAAALTGARILVIALPSAGSELVRELSGSARDAGLTVKVLPGLPELLNRRVGIRDVRDVDIADLLGRRQIETNVDEIAGYLTGRRVLVTGAGGSIGSELCRQIASYDPAELMLLDRDESALHAVVLSLHGQAWLDLPEALLADIRDADAVRELFVARRPEVVFHAAALKHLNMLEQYPEEGWKTNVLGTRNVLEAARAASVTHFINVSTDKAADPVNALGRTKRMAEQLTATYAERSAGRYLSVRFGNVLGSRGSVLDTFTAQIARGGPITVTHPDVTRYFMTIPEAVQLVIQAGAIGNGGEVLVLDMGAPVRIADVASSLIAMADRPINILFTGLRPGEKLHEDLFGREERDVRPIHPLISHVRVPPLDPETVLRLGRPAVDRRRPVPGPRANGVIAR